jgi:flagellar protein FliT
MKHVPTTEILGSYEYLAKVTLHMRDAAVKEDWDRVMQLESECAPVYSMLMTSEEHGPLDAQYQRRKSELICELLEHDAEIRERISGQLTNIWRLIHGRAKVEQISSAYGATN